MAKINERLEIRLVQHRKNPKHIFKVKIPLPPNSKEKIEQISFSPYQPVKRNEETIAEILFKELERLHVTYTPVIKDIPDPYIAADLTATQIASLEQMPYVDRLLDDDSVLTF